MVELTIEWKSDNEKTYHSDVVYVEENESDYYKAIGKKLLVVDFPGQLIADSKFGTTEYSIKQRGTYWNGDKKVPSMYVTKTYDSVRGLSPSTYPPVYLTCVSPGADNSSYGYGNYKFYQMSVENEEIKVSYGRIGASANEMFGKRHTVYPDTTLYWIRYYEKLSKLYQDKSSIYLTPVYSKPKSGHNDKDTNSIHYKFFNKLALYANNAIKSSLKETEVSEGMISESRKLYNELCKQTDVKSFNNLLLELFAISPRRTSSLNSLLAKKSTDFTSIINREENLILAMEGSVSHKTQTSDVDNIEVYIATKEQKEKVLNMLDPNLKRKVKEIYRVINPKHKRRFNAYLKRYNITNVKELWHGSRNQNWYSIIKNGLLLNPNAIITGKMFGNGIYFASKAQKSWGYTSYYGSYWANGHDNTAFMGVYATAYGNPMDCSSPQSYTQRMLNKAGKNCVHAHSGLWLRNDEIVFYSEAALLLNYIVEFQD